MIPNDPRRPPVLNDPDEQNAEQEDSGSQAQDVAEDALRRPWRSREGAGTSHGDKADPTQILPDDTPDLVDRMTDMDRSGRIDMDAFEGEDNMDDEDGSIPE